MRKGQVECNISQCLLSDFSEYLNKNMGLFYPEKAWSEFEKKIPHISSSFGFENQSECIQWIIKQPVTKDLITTLAEHLTIGETYFFRDNNTFELIKNKILEPLIAERRLSNQKQIKIWSAACCTGEEPYTLAMILCEMLPNIKDWNISILGSDINIEFLRRAKRGVYRDWALRAIPEHYLQKYFQKEAEGFAISPKIKKMVRFSYLNLIEDQYPSLTNGTSNADLVLCNNVLIYFSEVQGRRVIAQLDKSLVDGGHLCVTPIEASLVNAPTLNIQPDIACYIFRSNKMAIFNRANPQLDLLKDVSKDIHKKKTNIRKKSTFFEDFLKKSPKNDNEEKEQKLTSISEGHSDENSVLTRVNGLYKLGDYHKVVDEVESYLIESQDTESQHINLIMVLIKAYVNTGNLDQAKYCCEKYLSIDSTNPTLHYLHAAIFQEFNCIKEAISSLKKAIFLDGDFSIAYFTMGNLLLTQDDFYEARKHFRNVVITLDKVYDESIVPEAEELTAGRLKEIVENILTKL